MSRKSRSSPSSSSRRLVLIRHAEAVDGDDFDGSDLDRPLTSKGRKSARKNFQHLEKLIGRPEEIHHSEARRARETANALAETFPRALLSAHAELNPGAPASAILAIFRRGGDPVVLVGHEPDFSRAIRFLTGARCRLRKGSIAVLECSGHHFTLAGLWDRNVLERVT